jgi:hypothetical protein
MFGGLVYGLSYVAVHLYSNYAKDISIARRFLLDGEFVMRMDMNGFKRPAYHRF